jgi:hypothetical protein
MSLTVALGLSLVVAAILYMLTALAMDRIKDKE